MRSTLGLFFSLLGFWLLLSGIFTPLLLGFGVVSAALVAWLALRMDGVDRARCWAPVRWSRLPGYFAWLAREVYRANIDVMRRVLALDEVSPSVVEVPAVARTELGRVVFANSVTLTPGTLSVSLDDDRLLVHALSAEGAAELAAGGGESEMARRVAALEAAPYAAAKAGS